MYVCIDSPCGDYHFLARDGLCSGTEDHFVVNTLHNVWVSGLANPNYESIFDANVRLCSWLSWE